MEGREIADAQVTALALAAGRGDRGALEDLVRVTQRDVWRFLAHLAGPAHADDLTQETYVRAISSLPGFAGRSSARTWLLAIARRVSVDLIRREMSRPRISADVDWLEAADRTRSRAAGDTGHEGLVEANLLLAALAPERREALVLTQVLGFSYAEAAEVLQCRVGTIRSRVARAREELIAARNAGRDVS